jgi:hypothetical protein
VTTYLSVSRQLECILSLVGRAFQFRSKPGFAAHLRLHHPLTGSGALDDFGADFWRSGWGGKLKDYSLRQV